MECSTGDTMTVKERENLMKKVKPLENKLSNNKTCRARTTRSRRSAPSGPSRWTG